MPKAGTIVSEEQRIKNAEWQRQYRKEHPEITRETDRRSKEKHKEERREYDKLYARQYRAENPERVRVISQRCYSNHDEERRERRREKYYSDPIAAREQKRNRIERNKDSYLLAHRIDQLNRRTREMENGADLTKEQAIQILQTNCAFCNSSDDLTIAHDIPVVRGGATTLDNCFCLCRSCNSKMYTSTLNEYLDVENVYVI